MRPDDPALTGNQFMQRFSTKFKAGVSAVAVLAVLFGVYGFRKLQALAADPDGEKNCGPPMPRIRARPTWTRSRRLRRCRVKWSQLGGANQ